MLRRQSISVDYCVIHCLVRNALPLCASQHIPRWNCQLLPTDKMFLQPPCTDDIGKMCDRVRVEFTSIKCFPVDMPTDHLPSKRIKLVSQKQRLDATAKTDVNNAYIRALTT